MSMVFRAPRVHPRPRSVWMYHNETMIGVHALTVKETRFGMLTLKILLFSEMQHLASRFFLKYENLKMQKYVRTGSNRKTKESDDEIP